MTATLIAMPRSVRGGRSIPSVPRDDSAPSATALDGSTVVLVPVKSFADAKQRLRSVLTDQQRRALAQRCAETVLSAAGTLGVWVVCDDDDIEQWARSRGASVIRTDTPGLNPAIADGVAQLTRLGAGAIVVAHGDLPLAQDLGGVGSSSQRTRDAVTLVPDLVFDGTNVLVLPHAAAEGFVFRYGRGSFLAHLGEALRHGHPVRVVRDTLLAHDIDTPDDLDRPEMEEIRRWLQTNPDNHR